MINENNLNEEENEINLGELFNVLKSHIKMIVISVLTCILISAILTVFVMEKKYESTARLFLKPDVTEGIADSSQINSNNLMINNYVEMIKGNNIQSKVAKQLDLGTKYTMTVVNETDTQIISITAKTTDPVMSKKIVDEYVDVFTKEAKETLNVNNITVIDQSEVAKTPVSPSLKRNLLMGAFIGAFLSIGYLVIRFMFDTHIHNKEEAEKYLGIPLLGSIPYFED